LISQNGWPASQDQAQIGIKSFAVPGTKIKLRCAEKVAPLLVTFAAEFHQHIEPIDKGSLDDWGYCFRNVRGSSDKLSNHSSGTAIDLNAANHPLGHAGTFTVMQTVMIQALAKKYGLTWGGIWKRPDEMHFEISFNEAKCAELIGKLNLVKGK
jgi:D-alanyl-D-alanine carboxypeptidase